MRFVAAISLVLGITLASQTSYTEEGMYGVMMVVKGDIKVTGATDGKTESAKVGKKVMPGDTIVAGPESRAKIVMSDKNVLNISPDSKLVIEKYSNSAKEKTVELKVEYGKIRASVEQKYDGEKSKFNVKTPSAVAGVRGTDFLTSYSSTTKQSQVITFSGTVAVGKPGPGGSIANPVYVKPGQMTTATEGKGPDSPKTVPAEELNKMNRDTSADTASTKKQDNQQQSSEKSDKKKDDKNSDKSADKNSDKPADKAADKSADSKGTDAKSDTKSAGASNDKSPSSSGGNASGSQASTSGDAARAPASMPTSMVGAADLGPALVKDVNIAPPPAAAITTYVPPITTVTTPTTNTFINNAIQNRNVNTTIIINK